MRASFGAFPIILPDWQGWTFPILASKYWVNAEVYLLGSCLFLGD